MNTRQATGLETDPPKVAAPIENDGVFQSWAFPGSHFRLTQVELQDGTDRVNELVHERSWLLHPAEKHALCGNLFCLEDLAASKGWIFVLPAPLPHARPVKPDYDLRFLLLEDHLRVEACQPSGTRKWVLLAYTGGVVERTRVLHQWQASRRPAHALHERPLFLSNTWGDRSRDGRMHEAFMYEEIRLASEMGVDVVQLDDGWQKGISANSTLADQGGVWEGFWKSDPEFWTPHPTRFPRGLEPLVERAAECGVMLGLWFAPDSWQELQNWERDSDCLVALYRRYGVRHFKLDSIVAETETALGNLRRMIEKVQAESGREVVFDLDITAGTRPGPFGLLACGPLFVENRYTDWRNYWPHHTLRALWKLMTWVDPRRLRMEFLNPDRNRDRYTGDPLAPANYRSDALFAGVMWANPLGWFELAGLSDERRAEIADLCRLWKEHRDSLFAGTLLPIGECPNGFNFSGFISLPEESTGPIYLILFRGLTDSADFRLSVPKALESGRAWTMLGGEGSVLSEGEAVAGQIADPLGYLFARATAVEGASLQDYPSALGGG